MSFGQRNLDRQKPEIDFPEGDVPTELVIKDLIEGDGAEAKAGTPCPPTTWEWPGPPVKNSTPPGAAAHRWTSGSASARSSRAGTRASWA